MIAPELITPPAELLTLPEVKAHLDVDGSHHDTLIQGYVAAAVDWLDGWNGVLGRCILTQTWATRHAALEDLDLPFPDVVSAVVTYLDAAGATQTVAPADYRVRTEHGCGRLIFTEGFSAPALKSGRDDAVTVSAVYGRPTAPPALKVAALAIVSAHYDAEKNGTSFAMPAMVDQMIAPWRRLVAA